MALGPVGVREGRYPDRNRWPVPAGRGYPGPALTPLDVLPVRGVWVTEGYVSPVRDSVTPPDEDTKPLCYYYYYQQ